ncbi:RNA polymerase-binding transcription factor DksA [Paraburkholderia domus]|jgi:DnaK suppressor protein|uniref:RNA polymerase-binding transcription factor DksA n=1 Tax=Paraburkholderia domus TaxID=2793075 RepID=A0A9N8N163_9BURK|nr:TraR/DksA C4-type zinc finger protein [Paraburkholderia domus]MBK5048140.1 TraR/DksA family transcriptional regulator [Burkholderia sp. R-70006]MBK5060368.1 TraR/DksA family transcriptional regulator [Burkholderia sp. R-70199]MBK5085393.1 TraR/DksA family transcriptional regulator [Burkholderia sp. R-69927]MBK5122571.1 TraR/DksA family transcriptional regulator [Burkholderia sp. R-69980]MBK5168864.1 TraR/DksA family transcriptional regulator [Burkholderia sp. R-70211]MBK5182526.1 TraR/DksA
MPEQPVKLSDDFIAQQRKRLMALRQQLLGGEENTIADERAAQEQRGDEAEEFEDVAQGMAQNEVNQALHDVNDQRISDIGRALQKIDEGTYGLSDESGEPIPKARLEVTPEAILTVEEQSRREAGK